MMKVSRRILLGTFWTLALAIGVLALVPATLPLPSTGWDKANHALAFGVLAALGIACWPKQRLRVLLGLVAYGGAIEIAQWFTDTRSAEWLDLFADCIGISTGAIARTLREARTRLR